MGECGLAFRGEEVWSGLWADPTGKGKNSSRVWEDSAERGRGKNLAARGGCFCAIGRFAAGWSPRLLELHEVNRLLRSGNGTDKWKRRSLGMRTSVESSWGG